MIGLNDVVVVESLWNIFPSGQSMGFAHSCKLLQIRYCDAKHVSVFLPNQSTGVDGQHPVTGL
jgi:hypothetical protein